MLLLNFKSLLIITLLCSFRVVSGQTFWPDSKQAAICLTYDDAYDNHLDIVLPQLDLTGLKATFFVPVSTGSLVKRLEDWRSVTYKGHELGNHLNCHPCNWKSIGMEIPQGHGDLSNYTYAQYMSEVDSANKFLYEIDKAADRTFAYTCGQYIVDGTDISDSLYKKCIAGRAAGEIPLQMKDFNIYKTPSWCVPENTSGNELIKYVENARTNGTIAILMFHNIGGKSGSGGFNVDENEHLKFLQYLEINQDHFYCATFKEVMNYIKEKQNNP